MRTPVPMNLGIDQKLRYGGVLEIPWVSRVQRAVLDSGRLKGLGEALKGLDYKTILDVGCGLGEGALICRHQENYVGLDNSSPRIHYAARRFPCSHFIMADARSIPFHSQSFDLVLLSDLSHHLSDSDFLNVITELKRLARHYIVISDPVIFPNQGNLSRWLYRMDRGACFRSSEQSMGIFEKGGLICCKTIAHRTFPGFYVHQAFILSIPA